MGYDAEFSYVPNDILTKTAFYEHVLSNVQALLDDATEADARRKTNWVRGPVFRRYEKCGLSTLFKEVSALSSVSSVLYNSYADFERGSHGFGHTNRVNWTGKVPSSHHEQTAQS